MTDTISPEMFTNTEDGVCDQNEIFYKEYGSRVEDWECDEDMDEDDFATIHFGESENFDPETENDWVRIRYNMWYTCGVYLGYQEDDVESFCDWYNEEYS